MYWEYLVLFYEVNVLRAIIQNELNHYGQDRWELLSIICNLDENRIEYYFKRELLVELR